MKYKKAKLFLLGLLITVLASPVLYADEPDRVFPVFLTGLVRRHDELKTLTMPEVEIHTAEGYEDEAIYLLTFNTHNDYDIFIAALKAENVPYGTFPQRENQIVLFYSDMIRFLFWDVIRL